jgi:hypothetical protein
LPSSFFEDFREHCRYKLVVAWCWILSWRRSLFSVSFLHFHPPLLEPTIQSSSSSMTVEKLVFLLVQSNWWFDYLLILTFSKTQGYVPGFTWCWILSLKGKLIFSLFLAQKAFISFYFSLYILISHWAEKKFVCWHLQHCRSNIILHYLKCTLQLVVEITAIGWKLYSSLSFLISVSLECCSTQRLLSYWHFTKEKGLLINPKP